jgi:hypothetical protein
LGFSLSATAPAKTDRDSYNAEVQSYNDLRTLGGVFLVTGALFGVASAVLFILHRDPPRAPALSLILPSLDGALRAGLVVTFGGR